MKQKAAETLTVTEDISAANAIGPQLITKKPGLTPAFFTPLAREFLITFPFTEVIKLYLLCLLDETRPHCGLARMAHRIFRQTQ